MDHYKIVLIFVAVFTESFGHVCKIEIQTANCSRRRIQNIPQDLPSGIIIMDFRYNNITKLRNNVFRNYKNLTGLHLDHNKLSILEKDAFRGLDRLQNLSVAGNSLSLTTAYIHNVFEPLKALENLDIGQNIKFNVRSKIYYPFFGNLANLNSLSVDLVSSPIFDSCGLEKLKHMKIVVFDHCYIEYMSNKTFSHMPSNVEEVYFTGCKNIQAVETDVLRPFTRLQVLSLYQSNMELASALKILYPFENKTMETIDITRVNPGYECPISTPYAVIVTNEMMRYLQKICVHTLIIAENGIVDFEPNSILSYHHPECFKNIVLSGNRFSFLNGFKLRELWTLSPKLTNLTSFDLSYNPLSYGNVKYKMKLPHHNLYSSSDTWIQKKETTTCENYVEDLYTSHKNGSKLINAKIKHEIFNDEQIFFPIPYRLKTLRLTHYLSNQTLERHIVFMNASNLRYLDMSYFNVNNFPEITLQGPNNIDYIDLSGIESWRKSIQLFKNAKTVVIGYAGIWKYVQKRQHFFSFIPKVEKLDISGNNLWQLTHDTFSYNGKLTSLIMKGNLFDQLPTALMTISNLNYLDFSGNILDTINDTLRNWIDEQHKKTGSFKLFLTGNVFYCTCDTAEFVQWIFKTNIILDKPNKEYMCILSNGSITTIVKVFEKFHEFFGGCKSEMWLRIGIGLLVSFVVCAVPLAVVLNFKWQIAFWIYRKFRKVVEKELRQKFKYDIYLSYSHDSLHWVKNIMIPKIENSWKLKMCLEDRDILVGDVHADAISDSIEQSRHIIFIITNAFFRKNWGRFEIERAKYEKYTRKLQQIIVITKQVSVENFPLEFSHIWKDVILIKWCKDDRENNWDKLRMALFSEVI